MSARARIVDADGSVEEALGIKIEPGEYDPALDRIEILLRALVEAQVATAEAIVEGTEHRQLAFRVEHPGEILGA